jgi:activator of 2-hydroxyglutaryl-CoA dehydratase
VVGIGGDPVIGQTFSDVLARFAEDRETRAVVLIGGVALDPGFKPPLERELKASIIVPEYPEYVSALGAAVIAANPAR